MKAQVHIVTDPEFRQHGQDLEQAAYQTLAHQQPAHQHAELSIVLTGDRRMRKLNRQYAGSDEVTDVLAFPHEEPDPASGAVYLGDVIISVPRARTQAQAAGHSLSAELKLLTIHGVLHLLGHDHETPGQKARMWRAQAEVLEVLGGEIPVPPDR